MIFKNAMSFKAKIKQIAKEKNLATQQVQQSYLIEVFLEKLAKSKYRDNFIIKGGYLIGGIVGLDQRATMDLDTTIKGFELTDKILTEITKEIIEIPSEESFSFIFDSVSEIRETDDYPGFKIKLFADFERIHELVSIDVTTGDAITPKEIEFRVDRLFSDEKLALLSYPLETILAEKLETILSRGIASTRPRDCYDIYTLSKLRWNDIDFDVLKNALENTISKRESKIDVNEFNSTLELVKQSEVQQDLWKKYQRQYSYAKGIPFDVAIESVGSIMKELEVKTS